MQLKIDISLTSILFFSPCSMRKVTRRVRLKCFLYQTS